MIIRSYQTLPSTQETLARLQKGEPLHLIGPRQEALRAMLIGPILSTSISFGVLLWMLSSWQATDKLVFLLGPILGVLASFVWLLYSLRLLQSPRVEAGIHCSQQQLMTFSLRRGAPFHELAWSDCSSFLLKDDGLWLRLSPDPKRDSYIDTDFIEDGCVPLNLPSTVTDAAALCHWLEALRAALSTDTTSR